MFRGLGFRAPGLGVWVLVFRCNSPGLVFRGLGCQAGVVLIFFFVWGVGGWS